jgi:glutaredoxin-like YruB-family protein
MHITVYTTPTCPYCRQVKDFLKSRNVPYVERNVATDPQAAREMVGLTGSEAVPVTVVDGNVVVGFDQARLNFFLTRAANAPIRLGASVANAARIAEQTGDGITIGAFVGKVRPNSIAARAGVQKGDVIVELAGHPIRTAADIDGAVASLGHGQKSTLTYLRGRERQRVQFVV